MLGWSHYDRRWHATCTAGAPAAALAGVLGIGGQRAGEVDAVVSSWTSMMDARELDDALTEAEVPHGSIFRAPDMLEDPHYVARGMIHRVHDPVLEVIAAA